MKKIIMALLSIAFAANVQAATIPWVLGDDMYNHIKDRIWGDYTEMHVYLFDGSVHNDIVSQILFSETFYDLIDGLYDLFVVSSFEDLLYTTGEVEEKDQYDVFFVFAFLPSESWFESNPGEPDNIAFVIWSEPELLVANNGVLTVPANNNITWGGMVYTSPELPQTSIPEPATGLLALAGVALLLRRKRT